MITQIGKSTPRSGPAARRLKAAAGVGVGSVTTLAASGMAFAQAAGPAGGIGAQVQAMAGEGASAGGYVGSMAMYVAALVVFLGAAWALWKSRQPQNRESGYVGMGIAGLVLCGLFATGGAWIGKASQTATGTAATITSTPQAVTFN